MKKSILKIFLMLFTLSGMAQTYKITSPKVEVVSNDFSVRNSPIIKIAKSVSDSTSFFTVKADTSILTEFRAYKLRNNPYYSLFFGKNAGSKITTGWGNSGFGNNVLANVTTGADNNGFGGGVLSSLTTGVSNNGFGSGGVLEKLTTGSYNTNFGASGLANLTNGSYNTAFGSGNLYNLSTGNNNSVFGNSAARLLTSGNENNIFGNYSAYNLLTGQKNNIFGSGGFGYLGAESNNTIVGNANGTTGENNNVILADGLGNEILHVDATQRGDNRFLITNNSGVGVFRALQVEDIPSLNYLPSNTNLNFLPSNTPLNFLPSNTPLNFLNILNPNYTGLLSRNGTSLTDYSPLLSQTYYGWNQFDFRTNNANIYLGRESGKLTTSGVRNNNIGAEGLSAITTGIENNNIGTSGLLKLTTGSKNTAIGPLSVGINYTGAESNNTLIGAVAGTTGENNKVRIADGAGNEVINIDASNRTAGRVLTTDANGVGRFVVPASQSPDLLKEDVSNKSTSTALGTSNVLYPTQNAVKTYADTKAPINSPQFTGEPTAPLPSYTNDYQIATVGFVKEEIEGVIQSGLATLDFPLTPPGESSSLIVGINGVYYTDIVLVSYPSNANPTNNDIFKAKGSFTPNEVIITYCNNSNISKDLLPDNYIIKIIH